MLLEQFKNLSPLFIALGDENRQTILCYLIESTCHKNGRRVGEITEKTRLSRPAVSHHLKILKESGLIKNRKKGTMNFYYANINQTKLQELSQLITTLLKHTDPTEEK